MDKLKAISEVRKILTEAGSEAPPIAVPTIVVIGGQSAGKSSLLERLTGVPLPHGTETTTKCPIEVMMTPHEHSSDEPAFSVQGLEGLTIHTVSAAISEAQEGLLSGSAAAHHKTMSFTDQAVQVVARTAFPQELSIMDTPGLIANDEDVEAGSEDMITKLVQKLIQPDTSVIVVAVEAAHDMQTQAAVRLARDADPTGSRTLFVFTKCDVTSSAAKAENLRHRVVASLEQHSSARRGLSMAPHFVVVRGFKGELLHSEGERHALVETDSGKGISLDAEQARSPVVGVEGLRSRLEPILQRVVEQNIGAMTEQVQEWLREANAKMDAAGRSEPTPGQVLRRVADRLVAAASDDNLGPLWAEATIRMEAELAAATEAIVGDRGAVSKTVKEKMSTYRPPEFCGEPAFNQQLRKLGEAYSKILADFAVEQSDRARALVQAELEDVLSSASPRFSWAMRSNFVSAAGKMERDALARLEGQAQAAKRFFSRSSEYDTVQEKFDEEEIDSLGRFLAARITTGPTSPEAFFQILREHRRVTRPATPADRVTDHVMPVLEHVSTSQLKQVINGANVAMRECYMDPLLKWASELVDNESLKDDARESDSVLQRREHAKRNLRSAERCASRLRRLGVFVTNERRCSQSSISASEGKATGGAAAAASASSARPGRTTSWPKVAALRTAEELCKRMQDLGIDKDTEYEEMARLLDVVARAERLLLPRAAELLREASAPTI